MLMSNSSCPSPTSSQGPPLASLAIQAIAIATAAPSVPPSLYVLAPSASPSPSIVSIMLTLSAAPAIFSPSSLVLPLLSAGVATTSVLADLPHSSSTSLTSVSISTPLITPASSSLPSVSLDHVYTSRDTSSMWSMATYRSSELLVIFCSLLTKTSFDQLRYKI